MKVLWFSVTPLSLNAKENTGIEGKGWISSLLQIGIREPVAFQKGSRRNRETQDHSY